MNVLIAKQREIRTLLGIVVGIDQDPLTRG
jgi:hypothetical protein